MSDDTYLPPAFTPARELPKQNVDSGYAQNGEVKKIDPVVELMSEIDQARALYRTELAKENRDYPVLMGRIAQRLDAIAMYSAWAYSRETPIP